MPRYLIERRFEAISDDEMQETSFRSKSLIVEHFPDVVWEHSHVVTDESGAVKTFCVYSAPSQERIHEHAKLVGGHQIARLWEIVGDVRPEDLTA